MKLLYEKVKPHQVLFLVLDILIINGAYFLSVFLHRQFSFDAAIFVVLMMRVPYVTVIYIVFYLIRKLYSNLWKYMGFYEVVNLGACISLGTAISLVCWWDNRKVWAFWKSHRPFKNNAFCCICWCVYVYLLFINWHESVI